MAKKMKDSKGEAKTRYRLNHIELCEEDRRQLRSIDEGAKPDYFKVMHLYDCNTSRLNDWYIWQSGKWPKNGEEVDVSVFVHEGELLKLHLAPEMKEHKEKLSEVLHAFEHERIKDFLNNKPWRSGLWFFSSISLHAVGSP